MLDSLGIEPPTDYFRMGKINLAVNAFVGLASAITYSYVGYFAVPATIIGTYFGATQMDVSGAVGNSASRGDASSAGNNSASSESAAGNSSSKGSSRGG